MDGRWPFSSQEKPQQTAKPTSILIKQDFSPILLKKEKKIILRYKPGNLLILALLLSYPFLKQFDT